MLRALVGALFRTAIILCWKRTFWKLVIRYVCFTKKSRLICWMIVKSDSCLKRMLVWHLPREESLKKNPTSHQMMVAIAVAHKAACRVAVRHLTCLRRQSQCERTRAALLLETTPFSTSIDSLTRLLSHSKKVGIFVQRARHSSISSLSGKRKTSSGIFELELRLGNRIRQQLPR